MQMRGLSLLDLRWREMVVVVVVMRKRGKVVRVCSVRC
jgi:hypothetical protein